MTLFFILEFDFLDCYYECPNMMKVKLVSSQSECPDYEETNLANYVILERECTFVSETIWLFKFCIYQGCVDKLVSPNWSTCPNNYPNAYAQLLTDADGSCTKI